MFYNNGPKKIILDENPLQNIISVDNCDRYVAELEGVSGGGNGVNACVFKLVDPNGDLDDQVIKICRYYPPGSNSLFQKRIARFEREIAALKKGLAAGMQNFLIQIVADDCLSISGRTFRYFVMERADCDLGTYLANNLLSLQQRVVLCVDLLKSLRALHDLEIYHRDLKPANILFVDDRWKIADLGLVQFRIQDMDLDDIKERIGPFGFFSPEATNKALGNRELADFDFDCMIDHKSDLFQLGKIFWYILQGEVPTGQLLLDDFKVRGHQELFEEIIIPLLQYSKTRRPEITEIEARFVPIRERLAV